MALVADYTDSENECDNQEEVNEMHPDDCLFTALPTPIPLKALNAEDELEEIVQPKSYESDLRLSLPKPKVVKKPKIYMPRLEAASSDEDEEPASKKTKDTSLISLLPPPKNAGPIFQKNTAKDLTKGRAPFPMLPHVLTKPKNKTPIVSKESESSSDDDTDLLGINRKLVPNTEPVVKAKFTEIPDRQHRLDAQIAALENRSSKTESVYSRLTNRIKGEALGRPMDTAGSNPTHSSDYRIPPENLVVSDADLIENREEESSEEEDIAETMTTVEELKKSQPFSRLQGRRGREMEGDINIIDVHVDDFTSKQELLKGLTEETTYRSSASSGNGPSSLSKRKHQITYLAHMAKERELELKNTWSDNKLTRRQTQAKYGF